MIESLEPERGVLGALLLSDVALPAVMETGLKAGDFYYAINARVYTAMLALHDRGARVDALALASQANLLREDIEAMLMPAVQPANVVEHAKRVVELALWRQRGLAGQEIVQAADAEDEALYQQAEQRLAGGTRATSQTWSPDRMREALVEAIDNPTEAFGFPFQRLTTLTNGGMRRGQVTLLGGWTSHGKSLFLDQLLAHLADKCSVHLYINEMTPLERGLRWLGRESGATLGQLLTGETTQHGTRSAMQALNRGFPYPVTDVAGWSAIDISRHIRRTRPDVAALDILHLIAHREERDLAGISQELNVCAKRANCHIVATVHLNESRVQGVTRPMPTLGDIRGSGMLKNDADNVLFVFREQDADTGYPMTSASAYFSKQRAGPLGGVALRFDEDRVEFQPANWRDHA